MTPKPTDASPDHLVVSLEKVINLNHPLLRLAQELDWEGIRKEMEPSFCHANGQPEADVRVVFGLLYLKSAFKLSDGELIAQWVENPYWQRFCGFETMQHKSPIDSMAISQWRSRLGTEKLEIMLKKTIVVGQQKNSGPQ